MQPYTTFLEAKIWIVLFLGIPGVTAAIIGTVAFLFKERIKAYMTVDMQKEIDIHRHELQVELGGYTEGMKHDLQREMVRVQSFMSNKYTVYPELYKKILKAHGEIASLWGADWNINQDRYTEGDLHKHLVGNNVVQGEVDHILSLFRSDRKAGLKAFNIMMRQVKFSKAKRRYHLAKNYLLLKELFTSAEVSALTHDILINLWSVWVDCKTGEESMGSHDTSDSVDRTKTILTTQIEALKKMMRKELEPGP